MGLFRLSTSATAAVGVAAGLGASWIKVLVEAPMQRAGEKVFPPHPGQKDAVGADPGGHPERMPPAHIAGGAWLRLTGEQLGREELLKVQTVIHYTFGAAVGAAYALLARRFPAVTGGGGAPAGAVLYGMTHASLVPALGVQPFPHQLPRAAFVWEGGSHVVFGMAMEAGRYLLAGRAR